jgi:glycosyltransferase 2 family protein
LLVAQRQPVGPFQAWRGHLMGHVGKYVPGKAMVLFLRVMAVRGGGVRTSVVAAATAMETLFQMAIGCILGGLIAIVLGLPKFIALGAVAGGLLLALPTLPPLSELLMRLVLRNHARRDAIAGGYGWALAARGWLAMALSWSLIGLSFWVVVAALPAIAQAAGEEQRSAWTIDDYWRATAVMALATAAGFVSLLPGGAGVRELVVAYLLEPRIGAAHALLAAILARLVYLIVELLITLVLSFIRPTTNHASSQQGTT